MDLFLLDNELTGYILYYLHDKKCEIVVLQSLLENQNYWFIFDRICNRSCEKQQL